MSTNFMDSSKEMLDLWSNTQEKLVKNWTETSKKIQDQMKDGPAPSAGVETYKEWFDNQRVILNEAFEKGVAQTPTQALPEQARTWMHKQQEFTQKSIDVMSELMQKQMDASGKFPKMGENPQEMFRFATDYFKQWYEQTMEMMGKMKEYMPSNAMGDMYTKMLDSSKNYFNMYEMWENYNNMVKNGNYDVNSFFKMFDAEKYNSMLSDMTKNLMPFKFQDVSGQATAFMETYQKMLMNAGGQMPYKEVWENYLKMMPNMTQNMSQMMPGNFGNQMGAFQENFIDRMKGLYEPFYKLIPPSKEKEMGEVLVDMQSNLFKYQTKMYEMNALIGEKAGEANREVMEVLFEKAKNGEQPKAYDEYFKHWLDVLEKRMEETLQSSDFSKLQGEVLSLQLDLKTALNKAVEHALSPYPVALNSEIDELTKQVHDLKAKVRELQKSNKAATAPAEAPKKTTAKSTASSSASTAKKTTTRKSS